MVARCKICDVREYDTAHLCADLGADLLGLHAIRGVKPARRESLLEITRRFPNEFPHVGLVAVTLATAPEVIADIVDVLRPTHVQLHEGSWTAGAIARLREYLANRSSGCPLLIGVVRVPADAERIVEISQATDMLLLDRTHYGTDEERASVTPADYLEAMRHNNSRPTLVGGGLNPDNVEFYLSLLRPWGVDVQRGVEIDGSRGEKDPEKLRAFITRVKANPR